MDRNGRRAVTVTGPVSRIGAASLVTCQALREIEPSRVTLPA